MFSKQSSYTIQPINSGIFKHKCVGLGERVINFIENQGKLSYAFSI